MRPLADILGANKGSRPNLVAGSMAAFGAFIGMAIFIFLALGGVQAGPEAARSIDSEAGLTSDQIQSIAFSFGAVITAAIFICGPISGGVLNPAVLLSLVITGNVNWLRGILFFFAECLLTMCLCLTVLFVIVDKQSLAEYAPFVVGPAVFICHMICSPIDDTSVNPDRSFAASIVIGQWANHWIFWSGPLTGGIFFYHLLDL